MGMLRDLIIPLFSKVAIITADIPMGFVRTKWGSLGILGMSGAS